MFGFKKTIKPMKDYIAIGRKIEGGPIHAFLFVNHPTPSGCDRPMLSLSTTEGRSNGLEAFDLMISGLKPEYVKTLDFPSRKKMAAVHE